MKKLLWLCLITIGTSIPAFSCLNEELEDMPYEPSGKIQYGPSLLLDSFSSAGLHSRLQSLQALNGADTSFAIQNDISTVYMRLGDPSTARDILIGLEKRQPGTYSVAANLGTAYELLGQLDSALYWINKAVSIDPQSHMNSEWIHVMILRYKIAKAKNPQYLAGGSALMLNFGEKDLPENAYNMKVNEIMPQLGYQLKERLQFIPAPDTLMGMLLFDYANLHALQGELSGALVYFQKAREYGFSSELMEAREARIAELLKADPNATLNGQEPGEVQYEEGGGPNVYVIAGIIAVLAVLGVWLLLRKGKNR